MFSNFDAREDSRVPWTARRSNQSIRKGNQSWIFIGSTDAEGEAPILWLPDAKTWLIGKDLDAGKDWREEEKVMTQVEMAGWYHRLDAHEFGWILGIGDGQGGLACCDSWRCKKLDTTERLNWTELKFLELLKDFSGNCCLVGKSCSTLLPIPWTVVCQVPFSMGFPRPPEYWSGLPCISPWYLPHSETEPVSPALVGRFFTTEPPGKF